MQADKPDRPDRPEQAARVVPATIGAVTIAPGRRDGTAWRLLACIGVSFLPGLVGGRFVPGAWYEGLAKPTLTPPSWVFPVVWTTLYFAMGIALFLYRERPAHGDRSRRLGIGLFGAQLALNAAWSWLFFGLERPDLALVDVIALWAAILATLVVFARRRVAAAVLLAPYLAWVSFAASLNLSIWRLNA